jgi:hypothetical protein
MRTTFHGEGVESGTIFVNGSGGVKEHHFWLLAPQAVPVTHSGKDTLDRSENFSKFESYARFSFSVATWGGYNSNSIVVLIFLLL